MPKNFLSRIGTKLWLRTQGLSSRTNLEKIELIDCAWMQCLPAPASFADLGGVWGVNGSYTYYIIQKHRPQSAFLVDSDFTDVVVRKSKSFPGLKLIQGNLGEKSTADRVGSVDAVLLFDVLLHQVAPDWNDVLRNYADRTKCFIIYNQQWTGTAETVRLLDLGREEYFNNVPHDSNHETYANLFDKMYEMHPQYNRPWRDIHNVWQWGITDDALLQAMQGLGFKKLYYKNCGRFGTLKNFENHAFVFQKI